MERNQKKKTQVEIQFPQKLEAILLEIFTNLKDDPPSKTPDRNQSEKWSLAKSIFETLEEYRSEQEKSSGETKSTKRPTPKNNKEALRMPDLETWLETGGGGGDDLLDRDGEIFDDTGILENRNEDEKEVDVSAHDRREVETRNGEDHLNPDLRRYHEKMKECLIESEKITEWQYLLVNTLIFGSSRETRFPKLDDLVETTKLETNPSHAKKKGKRPRISPQPIFTHEIPAIKKAFCHTQHEIEEFLAQSMFINEPVGFNLAQCLQELRRFPMLATIFEVFGLSSWKEKVRRWTRKVFFNVCVPAQHVKSEESSDHKNIRHDHG